MTVPLFGEKQWQRSKCKIAMKPCDCWETRDNGLRERFGLKLSDACSVLELDKETLGLRAAYGLPLQRVDGKPLRRSDAKFIEITHCPFCGTAL